MAIATVTAVVYSIILLALFLMQKSFIFPVPHKNFLLYDKYKDISIRLPNDSNELQGWRINGSSPLSNIVIIYFGGNGEDVAATIPNLVKLPSSVIYTFNYRSYGLSSDSPSENFLYEDAFHIFDYVKDNHPESKIAIIGYSLGSAIAGKLASKRDASYLILLAPLYRLERIAKETFRSLIPSWIVSHRFDLSETVKQVETKSLVICAGNDLVIPHAHSEKTYSNISGPKAIYTIQNIGHNEVFAEIESYNIIKLFLTDDSRT